MILLHIHIKNNERICKSNFTAQVHSFKVFFLHKFVKAMTLHQYSKKTCFVKRINGLGRLPDKADEVFTNVDLCKAETFTW